MNTAVSRITISYYYDIAVVVSSGRPAGRPTCDVAASSAGGAGLPQQRRAPHERSESYRGARRRGAGDERRPPRLRARASTQVPPITPISIRNQWQCCTLDPEAEQATVNRADLIKPRTGGLGDSQDNTQHS